MNNIRYTEYFINTMLENREYNELNGKIFIILCYTIFLQFL